MNKITLGGSLVFCLGFHGLREISGPAELTSKSDMDPKWLVFQRRNFGVESQRARKTWASGSDGLRHMDAEIKPAIPDTEGKRVGGSENFFEANLASRTMKTSDALTRGGEERETLISIDGRMPSMRLPQLSLTPLSYLILRWARITDAFTFITMTSIIHV